MLVTPSSPFGPAVRYDRVAVAFHWIIAIGILMQVALGLWMIGIPKQPVGVRAYWFNVHKSIGMTLGMLIVLRFSWRLTHRPPPMPSAMPEWQARAAQITHVLLYACMLIQPLAGYLGSVFSGYPIKYFGYTLPAWGWKDEGLKDFFSTVHLVNATTFILLICVHVAAALKHWLIDRDGVFQRMLPRGNAAAVHRRPVADQGS